VRGNNQGHACFANLKERPDEMAAGGLSEKTGDRLSVCTRFFRKTDTALSRSFRVSYHSAARPPVTTPNSVASNRLHNAVAKTQAAANRNLLQVRLLYLHDDIVIPTGEVKSFVSG
jgi:hypothetical protein